MRGVFNKIFTSFHKKLYVLRKNDGLLFFCFDNCEPFEGEHEANVSNAFLCNTALLGLSGFS